MKKVLFVCIGNVCRSPMAEAFANHYGNDVLIAKSAGLAPLSEALPETRAIMEEVNVDLSKHVPMEYDPSLAGQYDIVVNMSGYLLPGKPPNQLLEWDVQDPFQRGSEAFRNARADVEQRVMQLILQMRRDKKKKR